jgi:hypothetical protein
MRTTLDLDPDVLAAVKELAHQRKVSAGAVVSDLVRKALAGPVFVLEDAAPRVGGFQPFASRGGVVSDSAVNALRDQEGV